MPRPKNPQPAKLVEISPSQQALIYGRGNVILLRGGDAWRLNDSEADALRVLIAEYQEARIAGSRSAS